MPRLQNPRKSEPNTDDSLEFDLERRRNTGATNSFKRRHSKRPAIAVVALLLLLCGVYWRYQTRPSTDRRAPALSTFEDTGKPAGDTGQTSPRPVSGKAATSASSSLSSSDGWPFPEAIDQFEAPVISDAPSSPASESSANRPATQQISGNAPAKTKPLASASAIPMSAFPTDERIWTKASGQYLLASALAYDEIQGTVMLRSSDGRTLSAVAVGDLCPADLDYLAQLTELATSQSPD